jgi:hypothetical protein
MSAWHARMHCTGGCLHAGTCRQGASAAGAAAYLAGGAGEVFILLTPLDGISQLSLKAALLSGAAHWLQQ